MVEVFYKLGVRHTPGTQLPEPNRRLSADGYEQHPFLACTGGQDTVA